MTLASINIKKRALKLVITSCDSHLLKLELERFGFYNSEVTVTHGPWSCYILKNNQQEIVLSSETGNKLGIKLV